MSTIPEWFWEAVDQKPESHYTEIEDIDLHYLSWNEAGGRGLYLSTGKCPRALVGLYCAGFLRPVSPNRDGYEWHGDSDHRSRTRLISTLMKLSQ